MAIYQKEDFENGTANIKSTAEFNSLLKFIHAYNKGKSLGEANGKSEESFADGVCANLGLSSGGAYWLKRAKALNQNHRLGEVPNESDEKALCEDFRAYATAEIDAKTSEKTTIDKKVEEEKNYVAEYNRAVRTVKNARRAVWGPFALWGAIGFAGTIVLTAVLPAIAGITMLGGAFTTGFAGLATLVTGVIGGSRGLFGEGGRLRKLQDAKDALSAKRQPELQKLLTEQSKLQTELDDFNSVFNGKDSVSSSLKTMIANDKTEFQSDIEKIYNNVVTADSKRTYLTAGIGKGESDRVKGDMQGIIANLESLKNKSAADLSASDLAEAKRLEAEANGFDVAHIRDKADKTVKAITAHNDVIDEFVKALPDTIKTDVNVENAINNVKNKTNGYNATNVALHENDTQAKLEQAERNIRDEVVLAKAEIAKAWASQSKNEKLEDTNPKASEYKAIIEAVKDGGAYQKSIENNNNIANNHTKTEEERENARNEVERIGKYTELFLQKARLMKALESATNNGNDFGFYDSSSRLVHVKSADFATIISNGITEVENNITGLNSGTEPKFKTITDEVNKIEEYLKIQENAKASGKGKPKKTKASTISKKQKDKVKFQIANIYKEIENAKKSVSYADIDNIFTKEVNALIAEFEDAHTNSYYKQIDNLTDVSTFKSEAQKIVDSAKNAKNDALQKISENKETLAKAKKDNAYAELKQKQKDAKDKIASALNDFEQKYNSLKNDGKLEELGAQEYVHWYARAHMELINAIATFSQDVNSINDKSKLDEIIAGHGNFADYFSGLKTELNDVDKRAEECKLLFNSWFIDRGSKTEQKRSRLEQELDKIIGISEENKTKALNRFDDEMANAKNFIETDKTMYSLGRLKMELDDKTFDEFVKNLVDYVKEETEQAKINEDPEHSKTPDEHTTGETGMTVITKQGEEITLPGNPDERTTGETGMTVITKQGEEITLPVNPDERTTGETGMTVITKQGEEITLPGNSEKHTTGDTGANPDGDKTGTGQSEKPETEHAKDKRPDEHTLFEKQLDETIVNVKKSITKLLIVNSRVTVTYKNGTKQKMSVSDMEKYVKEFDPSYKDVVGKKLGLSRTVEKPEIEIIALYIALQQMGKESGEEREM